MVNGDEDVDVDVQRKAGTGRASRAYRSPIDARAFET